MVTYKGKQCRLLLGNGDKMVIVDAKGKHYYVNRSELDNYHE